MVFLLMGLFQKPLINVSYVSKLYDVAYNAKKTLRHKITTTISQNWIKAGNLDHKKHVSKILDHCYGRGSAKVM